MNKTQAIVFFGIIILGVIVSIFTLSKCSPSGESAKTTPSVAATTPAKTPSHPQAAAKEKKTSAKDSNPKANKTMAATSANAKTTAKTAPVTKKIPAFTTEKSLMSALIKAVQDKDLAKLLDLSGKNSLTDKAREHLTRLLKRDDLKLDPKQSLTAIGRTQDSTRWMLRLLSSSGESIEIITDLAKNKKGAWTVKKMRPLHSSSKTMSATATNSNTAKTKPGSADEPGDRPDAMMVAYAFSKAAIAKDIKTARAFSDPKRLNNEKLAALLIALEEGEFQLKADKALVVTLSRDDLTWAITRVESASDKSEFGVEMNMSEDGRWLVSGLTFSKLISMTAMAAGGGDVAYTPIRKNPKGGDSLVLYFEFDNEQVSARTRKQLAIVAAILSEDKNRKLHINGHADAKGDDNYNVTLSKRRTDAVKSTLIELGVNPKQIVTKAFGESKPLKPNFKADGSDNPAGRAQNRRTEIYLDF